MKGEGGYREGMPSYFSVGVFEHPGKRGPRLLAYTTMFNPQWNGCCLHRVEALNGTEAKRAALAQHRARCMAAAPPVNLPPGAPEEQ